MMIFSIMKSWVRCQSLSDCQLEFPSFKLHHKGDKAEEELPREFWEESIERQRKATVTAWALVLPSLDH